MIAKAVILFALVSFAIAGCSDYTGNCLACTTTPGCRFCYSTSYSVPPICTNLTNAEQAGCVDNNEGGTGDLINRFYQCQDCSSAEDCGECLQLSSACSFCFATSSCVPRDGSSDPLNANYNKTSSQCSDGLVLGSCIAPCKYRSSCGGCLADSKCFWCNNECFSSSQQTGCVAECPAELQNFASLLGVGILSFAAVFI